MFNTEVLSIEPEAREDRTKGGLELVNMHHICEYVCIKPQRKCGTGLLHRFLMFHTLTCFKQSVPKELSS